jgi:hypothetical protein
MEAEALRLSVAERVRLVDALLDSLDDEAAREIDAAWASRSRIPARRGGKRRIADRGRFYLPCRGSKTTFVVNYRFTTAADKELVAAAEFYESASSGLGGRFLDELEATVRRVLPQGGSVSPT